jgi:galactosamine-6-phosphate isomerase
MNLHFFDSYQAMSDAASEWVWGEIKNKSNLLMCAATGGSPTGLYKNLANLYKTN